MAATSLTDADAASSSATSPTPDQTKSSETLPEQFMKLVSGNPQFREAEKPGKAFVIVGQRPPPLR